MHTHQDRIEPSKGVLGVATDVVVFGAGFVNAGPGELACVVEYPLGNLTLVSATLLDAERIACTVPPLLAHLPHANETALVGVTLSRSLHDALGGSASLVSSARSGS